MVTKYSLSLILLFIIFIMSLTITTAYSRESIRVLPDKQHQTYSTIDSISYSEAMPIKQLFNDLEGPEIKDGDFAYTHNQVELGHRWGAFELAVFWRYDYFLTFTPDTAWLFYLNKNKKSYNTATANQAGLELKDYNIDLNANHIQSRGAAIGYTFDLLPELAVKTRLNYFHSGDMTYGSLSGNVTASADDYQGTLYLDYAYKHDSLLDREEESILGQGVGIDIDIFWQLTSELSLYMQGRDVFSYIDWHDVTYTKAKAITDRVSYDENGLIHVIPNISGTRGYRDEIQRLPSRYLFDLNYQLKDWQLAMQWFRYDKFNFPRVMLGTRERTVDWHVGYDFKTNAIEVGLEHSNVSFKVKSDQLDINKAHDFSLGLSINYVI
ncbi:hypothetical protein [Colwellia ponticola]|uniref:Uncharacterized protein n=1 Tax=Colwellia ponticola TaxID=2304625 RepID=A0A8H2JKP9_9GAMM|nr:hypothetical protein [Colwellia ponticola]TMM45072.1 hypothetical protein FCS21_09890 [Colwellia ponticola]